MIYKIYKSNKETANNFIWRCLQVFGKQGVTFLIFILCAKLLSPYEFGIYNYLLAIIFSLILFGDFGISTATSNYVVEQSVKNKEKLDYILFNSGIIIVILTILISFFTLIIGPLYLKDKYQYIFYLLPMILLAPLTSLYDGVYRGLKKFKQLALISVVIGIFSIVLVYFLVHKYGLIGALISQSVFYCLLLFSLAISFKGFKFKIRFDKQLIKSITSYSILLGLSSIGYVLYTRIDVLVLGHFGYIEEISYYEVINKIFILILLPVLILSTVVAPNTTKNFSLKRYSYIKKKIRKEVFGLIVAGIVVSLGLYFISPFIFKEFLNEYDLSVLTSVMNLTLLVLPFRFFSNYLTGSYIVAGGFAKLSTVTLLIFGILNLVLDIILIKSFGLIGIIYSTLIVQISFALSKDLYFYFKIIKKLEKEELSNK
jgi:O-antigen/teichoic acid export membrane protein